MDIFPFIPDFTSSVESKASITKISFGDGYSQRAAKNCSVVQETWNLKFNRKQSEIDEITAWLKDKGGWDEFLYTTPLGDTKQFICEKWAETKDTYNSTTLSVTLMEKL